jgi:phage terminase small subunit
VREKHKLFAEEYIKTLNITQSAKNAGYSAKTAYAIGFKLLKNADIQEYIKKRMAEVDHQKIASANEVLETLTRIIRGQEKEQFDLDVAIQDKLKAAELLGKRYALFTDKLDVSGGDIAVTLAKARERANEVSDND